MPNMLDYAKTNSPEPFSAIPLGPVDGVLLAQLAYFAFDQLPVKSGTLHALKPRQFGPLTEATWRPQANRALLKLMTQAPRYQQLAWHDLVTELDVEAQKQFSAVTLSLPEGGQVIAFRGTRAAFVDWKEDFNMAYMQAIPSQIEALAYFQRIAATYPGPYYLAGHSKGGTLATYAFVKAPAALQDQVTAIFNADGPGIGEPVPAVLAPRVHKLVPQTSLIGTLFDPASGFSVVQSTAHGFAQHDPFSWAVAGEDFVSLPKTDQLSQLAQDTIATWTASMDDATKQACLDAAYALVTQTDASTFAELKQHWPQNAKIIFSGLRHGDPMAHQQWQFAIGQLIVALRSTLLHPHLPTLDWPWTSSDSATNHEDAPHDQT